MKRWPAIAGFLFVVLAFASAFVVDQVDTEDADAIVELGRFYADSENVDMSVLAFVFGVGGLFFFLWFLGGLWAIVRRAEAGPTPLTGVVWAGGVVFVVAGAIEHALANVVGITLNFSDAYKLDANNAILVDSMGTGAFLVAMIGAGAMAIAAGLVVQRTRVLPVWVAWLGYVLGALTLPLIPYLSFIAALLLAVWVVAISVVMLRQPDEAATSVA